MIFFRWLILLLLLSAIGAFVLFMITGQPRFKRYGLLTLKWVLLSAFGFFAVLIVQQWA